MSDVVDGVGGDGDAIACSPPPPPPRYLGHDLDADIDAGLVSCDRICDDPSAEDGNALELWYPSRHR